MHPRNAKIGYPVTVDQSTMLSCSSTTGALLATERTTVRLYTVFRAVVQFGVQTVQE